MGHHRLMKHGYFNLKFYKSIACIKQVGDMRICRLLGGINIYMSQYTYVGAAAYHDNDVKQKRFI